MSGSPVYLDDKLLGAIAYAWDFGTDAIGGITPFVEMVEYSNPVKRQIQWMTDTSSYNVHGPVAVLTGQGGLQPVSAGGLDGFEAAAGAGMRLTPIQTPVTATGFSSEALAELSRHLGPMGMFPVQGGGIPNRSSSSTPMPRSNPAERWRSAWSPAICR